MTITTWKREYELGIKTIDDDHKILLQHMNDLEVAMLFGRGKDELSGVLEGVINYTRTHFAKEEKLMHEFHYPDTAAHKAEHDRFLKAVHDFQKQFNEGDITAPLKVLNMLREWVHNHMLHEDRKFVACFREHGL